MGMTHEPGREVPPLAIAVPSDLAEHLLAAGCGQKLSFRSFDPGAAVPVIVAGTGLAASAVTLLLQGREALRETADMVRSWLSSRRGSYRFTYRDGENSIEVTLAPGAAPELIEDLLGTVARLASRP